MTTNISAVSVSHTDDKKATQDIMSRIANLGSHLNRLSNSIELLGMRLQPVLRTEVQMSRDGQECVRPASQDSHLAVILDTISDDAWRAIDSIERLTRQLDLPDPAMSLVGACRPKPGETQHRLIHGSSPP